MTLEPTVGDVRPGRYGGWFGWTGLKPWASSKFVQPWRPTRKWASRAAVRKVRRHDRDRQKRSRPWRPAAETEDR
jgi:hypothetical protein